MSPESLPTVQVTWWSPACQPFSVGISEMKLYCDSVAGMPTNFSNSATQKSSASWATLSSPGQASPVSVVS